MSTVNNENNVENEENEQEQEIAEPLPTDEAQHNAWWKGVWLGAVPMALFMYWGIGWNHFDSHEAMPYKAEALPLTTEVSKPVPEPTRYVAASAEEKPVPRRKVSADKLGADFNGNGLAAAKRYGEPFLLSGRIYSVDMTYDGEQVLVHLHSTGAMGGIAAYLAPGQSDKAEELQKDHKVTLLCQKARDNMILQAGLCWIQ